MTVVHASDAVPFEIHGSRFLSFVRPSTGSEQLCAWQLAVPAGLRGVAHRPSREEVLLVLDGELHATVDGAASVLQPGEVLLVPARAELTVGAGAAGASAWVTTTAGLTAETADGSVIRPPWAV